MMEPLRNKWAVGVIAFSVVTVLVYIFMPLFKIPIFGISSGVEWIRMVWMTKDFANIVSFLLPFIGAAGAISVVLTKKIEPHILSVAFALLQVIFFAYFLMRMGAFVDSGVSAGGISLFDLIGSGTWTGLLSSLLATVASVMLVVTDFKKSKN
ncbi:MAG: hypothetical protein IAB88_03415 [Bacteroidetes bacterium]|uniref:Uncharacterized protein n=1 Tax=Candidatus Limisoma faecipullorum TaxID=2840854 RepID=A0A9D9IPL2_9BACT|nr:hypothetical protein [Candidatus Limisoma faecipullorum]